MSDPERATFSSWDGTRLSYRDFGRADGTPIVFVNGLLCNETYWMFLHRDLEPTWRILNADLRGHGFSSSPADPAAVRVEDSARDVCALLDHLGLDRVHLAGFSLGVQISLEAYRQAPDRFRTLMLFTGPFENPLATFYDLAIPTRFWDVTLTALADRLPDVTRRGWHAVFRLPIVHGVARAAGATRAPGWMMQGFYDHQLQADIPTCLRMARASTHHSARDVLPTIRVPTLVIAGEKDTFCPPSLSAVMRDLIPDCTFDLVPGGTHTTLLEEPVRVDRTTQAFLAAHGA